MTLYLLDTNVASAAINQDLGIDARLCKLRPEEWCISAITRAEIRYGVARKPEAARLARRVDAFLRASWTVAWDETAADEYGRLSATLRAAGTPIGVQDEMIAAHAAALDAILVTANLRHFSCVPGLRLENWLRPT